MKTSVERLVFFFAYCFLGADYLWVINTSCPAVRSIHAQKRGILAPIGAIVELLGLLKAKEIKCTSNKLNFR